MSKAIPILFLSVFVYVVCMLVWMSITAPKPPVTLSAPRLVTNGVNLIIYLNKEESLLFRDNKMHVEVRGMAQ